MQNNWQSVEKSETNSWLEVVLQVRSNIIDTSHYTFLSYENFKNFWREDN
jgi:hypothetical protein